MTLADIVLITKKIAIGIVIFLIPLIVISGAIWFVFNLLNN
ncbi:hypothetical protein FHW36_107241 [Chitinophaga polysaccharea]|uniref:Uncharacterized protein n=1 Tax=Chitinophaga polysaccharea TaxID=1293035 RepID=A0A561PGS1_9BACT|nr:hypothetical protein [Chitinophaga eiseniae]TWF37314.1 hypothetical protein FHW36_107241 [Chitinophaga polysaccharea]